MGNICIKGGSGSGKSTTGISTQENEKESTNNNSYGGETDYTDAVNKMKEFHFDRLRQEVDKDPHTFILDNLLMCIQFFDNFEKSVDEANEYRRSAEREMTELLAKDSHEGMILGDRRIKLLTGMSHILAQNYIYSGNNQNQEGDEVDSVYDSVNLKDTFIIEGILPLEFIMSWDNFELYHPDEVESVKDYSDAKGASPSARFCIEQPDKKTEFPKGYVRLRCVDDPISHRKPLEAPRHSSSDVGYAHEPVYSQTYSDAVPEAHSESDDTAPNSDATSDDDVDMLQERLKSLPSPNRATSSTFIRNQNQPSTSKGRFQSGSSKPNLTKLNMPLFTADRNESYPSLVIHAPTPPVLEGQLQSQSFENGLLHPRTKPGRILNHNLSRSTPNLPSSDRFLTGTDTGYDTPSTMSRTSSMQSEMLRDKWPKQNLKKLTDFGKRSRKDQIPALGKYDPIPAECYSEVKFEIRFDAPPEEMEDEEVDDDDDEEEDDSDDGEVDVSKILENFTSNKKNTKKTQEDDVYQMRFYLNSLQFSSNACAEFQFVGQSLTFPPTSLRNGVVLGTTIRCPIPYAFPKESEDEDVGNYYVTYSFTPAIHGKSWPKDLIDGFRFQTILSRPKIHGEMWPSHDQIDQIEMSGCNTIPLGYRALGFFNAEQILEWELNFQECEINLLSSFRSPQWRAYIFASILFRGFMAPLGPQGVGLEHIRNILYYMCHQNYSGWEEEQPGVHLSKLIGHLYDCLSQAQMPSFFVKERNLLQSIPKHNIQFVQGHLNRIRENLIVYCIYAFRNLKYIRKAETYPLPNFQRLYQILTCDDTELLRIVNPVLQIQKDREDEEKREKERQRSRKSKKQKKPNPIEQQDEIDKNFFKSQREILNRPPRKDRVKKALEKGYRRHERDLEARKKAQRKQDREAQRLKEDPEHRLPQGEKRDSIDLKKVPEMPAKFTNIRILVVIQFFIKHFLKMANKATELQNYSQATMYVLQIDNLCEIAKARQSKGDSIGIFSEEEFGKIRAETLRLDGIIGKDKQLYILAKFSNPSSSAPYSHLAPSRSLNELSQVKSSDMDLPSFKSNWDLRKLPTPPPSEKDTRTTIKKVEKPNILSSLQSFDSFSNTRMSSEASTPTVMSPTPRASTAAEKYKARRNESIKFVSPVLPKDGPPPETPPRSPSLLLSRQSISLVDLDRDNSDEHESTDL